MNVFHRFTRESLIRNRSRTLVTIVGIILSVALLTAVTEGAYSGVQFLRRSVEQRVGSFFGYFDNLTEGEASQLTQSHEVTKSTTCRTSAGRRSAAATTISRICTLSPSTRISARSSP